MKLKTMVISIIPLIVLVLLGFVGAVMAGEASQIIASGSQNNVEMIAAAQNSVVSIQIDRSLWWNKRFRSFLGQFFNDYFESNEPDKEMISWKCVGSGVLIDVSGLILTNEHVITEADRIIVVFKDQKRYSAKVVGKNKKEDLALLKIEKVEKFPVIPFGDSDLTQVGEEVFAIGTPYGYEHTVTRGIVSATKRQLKQDKEVLFDDVIQTDASLNPGNSGGPLLNSRGEMIGMACVGDWRARGISFALSINKIKGCIAELKSSRLFYEKLAAFKNRFGFLPRETQNQQKEPEVLIEELVPNSMAFHAQLYLGDRLVKFGDLYVRDLETLLEVAGKVKPKQRIYVQIERQKRFFFTYLEVKS